MYIANMRARPHAAAAFGLLTVLGGLTGCQALSPRMEDSQAPIDFYRQISSSQKPCGHSVALIASGTTPTPPYDELSLISSTCSPGTPMLCDRILLETACELGADAVIVVRPKSGATPLGASALSQISKLGRAVRFRINPPYTQSAAAPRLTPRDSLLD